MKYIQHEVDEEECAVLLHYHTSLSISTRYNYGLYGARMLMIHKADIYLSSIRKCIYDRFKESRLLFTFCCFSLWPANICVMIHDCQLGQHGVIAEVEPFRCILQHP